MILILFIILIGIFIWYQFIAKPKENKDFILWLDEKSEVINFKQEIKNILLQLSNQIAPCKKCLTKAHQIWDINSSITFRCCKCKRKTEFEVDSIEDIKFILDSYISLYIDFHSTNNSKIKDYLKDYLEWDFDSVRKGNSFYTVFEIESLKEIESEVLSVSQKKKTRRISQQIKNQVWNRDNGKCVECGSNEKLEFDHIIPYSKGGANTYRNIQLLCENCNRVKSDKIG
ncbi:MAG: HNH endonuclease [Polaribacter sp.]